MVRQSDQNVDDFGGLLNKQIQSNAATFLYEYTDKIRNNIAHENEKFKIGEYSSFDDIVDAFYTIIVTINEKYRNNTGFDLEEEIKINMERRRIGSSPGPSRRRGL